MGRNPTPDWVEPVLWACTAGFVIVGALLLVCWVCVVFKSKRALLNTRTEDRPSGQFAESASRASIPLSDPEAAPTNEALDCGRNAPELVGIPTDPRDLAALRLLKGARFGDGGRIVLPSGYSITSQQARELTQDS